MSHPHSGYQSTLVHPEPPQYPTMTNQYPVSRETNQRGFIPTPSELINAYPTLPGRSQPTSHNSQRLDATSGFPHSRHPQSQLKNITVLSHAPSLSAPNSPPTQAAERYPCEKCEKTFSRSVLNLPTEFSSANLWRVGPMIENGIMKRNITLCR